MDVIARRGHCEWILYDYNPVTTMYKSYTVLVHVNEAHNEKELIRNPNSSRIKALSSTDIEKIK